MIATLREQFNNNFTQEKYATFLKDLDSKNPGAIQFRIAETPIFVPAAFREKMIGACESIVDVINDPGFMKLTCSAIPPGENVPNETRHPHCIAFDFGICKNDDGTLE